MIVNNGKTQVKQYFGGQVPVIANSIGLGSGSTPVTVTDSALVTEIIRVPITVIAADLDNDRIVFKAIVSPGYITSFTEIALFYGSNTDSLGGTMVARTVLGTAQAVDAHIPTEIEYSLGIVV